MSSIPSQLRVLDASMRVVILHGKDVSLLEEGTRVLAGVLGDQYGKIHQDTGKKDPIPRVTFDGETAGLADVLDELRSLDLFQDHKLVIVDRASHFLRGGAQAEGGEARGSKGEGAQRRRALEAYVENPCAGATLLLRSEGWHPGRLDKLVAKVGAVIKCDPLKDRDAVAWAVAACPDRHGLAMDRPAAQLLVERVGPVLGRLNSEMQKLAAFVGPGRKIGRDDVVELVGPSRQEQAWELQTAIMTGRPEEACVKMRQLMEISRLDAVLIIWAVSDLLGRLDTLGLLSGLGVELRPFIRPVRLWELTGDRMI